MLVDIPQTEDMPDGKALDLMQSSPIMGFDATIRGTTSYDDSKDSDVVVITAGIPRKPGMSRDDLLATNAKIVDDGVRAGRKRTSPNAVVIVVSNPLDAMVQTRIAGDRLSDAAALSARPACSTRPAIARFWRWSWA